MKHEGCDGRKSIEHMMRGVDVTRLYIGVAMYPPERKVSVLNEQ